MRHGQASSLLRHCEAGNCLASLRVAPSDSVIARRAAPWQSMSSCDGHWIASFLAMTGRGATTRRGAMTRPCVIARRVPLQSLRAAQPFRHCEARSAVAIHALDQPPLHRFVIRDDDLAGDLLMPPRLSPPVRAARRCGAAPGREPSSSAVGVLQSCGAARA